MSESPEKSSQITILITVVSFALLGVGALYIAINTTFSLIRHIIYLPESIEFNKGALYLWGVGFVLLLFVVGIVYTNYLKKTISKKTNKRLTQFVIFLLLLTFLLPQVVHYVTAEYLEKKDYKICESKSRQWLHVKTIVYSRLSSCEYT